MLRLITSVCINNGRLKIVKKKAKITPTGPEKSFNLRQAPSSDLRGHVEDRPKSVEQFVSSPTYARKKKGKKKSKQDKKWLV